MNDLATDLVERVIPEVPVRQWVCSLPFRLRYLCGYDRELCAYVLGAFVGELRRSLAWRAKRTLSLASVADGLTATITFVQRFDSGLRLNVHFHVLALDGVYVRDAASGARSAAARATLPLSMSAADRSAAPRALRRRPRSLHDEQALARRHALPRVRARRSARSFVCHGAAPALVFNPVSRLALGSRVSALRSDSVTP